ncbi:response regulator transcription factor [Thiomicrorhabdus sp. Kp2]|uniref:response regulator transcription factor n=1 Tax=Thiomicrorhabdus sp. Kp2 TaxID=1123518 RepID=UPI00041D1963|nr:response regulator transcription factor [Thiomicrorhabdus sp. Kp2]
MQLNILLVEDNLDLANTLIDFFELESIICDHAFNGKIGQHLALINQYDVILLDINLPGMNGLEVCQSLRLSGIEIPILMLTAQNGLSDKLIGFEKGADDYLIKPFEILELIARVRVLAKRRSGATQKLTIGALEMDIASHQVSMNSQILKISPTEWIILEKLMRASPQAVSKQELIRAVWGEESPPTDNLKVHIHHLRKEIEQQSALPIIQTVAGYGFLIPAPQEKNA